MSSKYSQRMLRLSGKIFGELRRPQMPANIHKDRIYDDSVRKAFNEFNNKNEEVITKLSSLPLDLDVRRNPKYYPPHPQHVNLINTLREMGLFRDEHLDFREEMIRQRVMRGKALKHRNKKSTEEEEKEE